MWLSSVLFHVLTIYSILLALEVLNLSPSQHIKLGFNSMCGYASVNHLHWHLQYQQHKLSVQTLPLSHVCGTPYHIYSGQAYPAWGWVWLLRDENMDRLEDVAKEVAKLTNWLTNNEVAHNVFITRLINFMKIYNCLLAFILGGQA